MLNKEKQAFCKEIIENIFELRYEHMGKAVTVVTLLRLTSTPQNRKAEGFIGLSFKIIMIQLFCIGCVTIIY